MSRNAWLTVDDIPEARTTRVITLPDSDAWLAILRGALSPLIDEANFEQFGTLTPAEMAEEWFRIFNEFLEEPPMLIPPGIVMEFAGSVLPAGFLWADGSAVSRTIYANLFAALGTIHGPGDGSTTFNLPNRKGRVGVGLDPAQTEFDTLGETGGSKTHTLTTAEMPSHGHIQDTHNHNQINHNHTQTSHNHLQDVHGHNVSPHSHTLDGGINAAAGAVGRSMIAQGSGSNNTLSRETNVTVASATATNQGTIAANVGTQAVNVTTVATNQNTGGGGAHNNMPPFYVSNFIIKT